MKKKLALEQLGKVKGELPFTVGLENAVLFAKSVKGWHDPAASVLQ